MLNYISFCWYPIYESSTYHFWYCVAVVNVLWTNYYYYYSKTTVAVSYSHFLTTHVLQHMFTHVRGESRDRENLKSRKLEKKIPLDSKFSRIQQSVEKTLVCSLSTNTKVRLDLWEIGKKNSYSNQNFPGFNIALRRHLFAA